MWQPRCQIKNPCALCDPHVSSFTCPAAAKISTNILMSLCSLISWMRDLFVNDFFPHYLIKKAGCLATALITGGFRHSAWTVPSQYQWSNNVLELVRVCYEEKTARAPCDCPLINFLSPSLETHTVMFRLGSSSPWNSKVAPSCLAPIPPPTAVPGCCSNFPTHA